MRLIGSSKGVRTLVKKLIVSLASVALVAACLLGPRVGISQEKPKTAAAESPHQVGLIDMAYVFKEYAKFKTMSESLKSEVEATDNEAKAMVTTLQQLQAQLTSGTIAEGSPDQAALEQKFVKTQTELETFKKMKQREFLRKEADIYKAVYLEVQDAVKLYADHYHFTLIMRFNRDTVEGADNPQEIIQSMNRPVVFHRTQDDITEPILTYLNGQYNKTATRPAAATAPAATRTK